MIAKGSLLSGLVVLACAACLTSLVLFSDSPALAAEKRLASVTSCSGKEVKLRKEEAEMVRLVNRARTDRSLNRVCVRPAVRKAARAHSADMLRRDYFSHRTKGTGEDPGDRLDRVGYPWIRYGELIFFSGGGFGDESGVYSAEKVFRVWMSRSYNREIILDRRLREIGPAVVDGEYNQDGQMWTVVLATK
ncbi:Cysteine-rich secretory protein family (plasmid) [Rubrobacter radiotolerans]|uniref:CAP domain-containing protein n=1 Tax=Rubrobacter radiotolerans TaxID=42256 RepID=A0A023X880_RUBRA|nr:CAP domain-containing protein [Rubrobacter radiotolerans]AHY48416.1 Cysteine-rich secretory protein family [Rubrobacter radiotolerans]MDX5895612.1 CAP domain-containing protein [Rubrobacter radiotolerans]SMC01421.1 Cysteine-rich secretory protein family protein [Rubrobacter radiotolerans DSM 5868]